MNARPRNHSVSRRGHRTSISLEDEFWDEFRAIAVARGMPINALVTEIDATRGLDIGLAGAIRLFVLRSLKERLLKAK